jgi:hypothetical protein
MHEERHHVEFQSPSTGESQPAVAIQLFADHGLDWVNIQGLSLWLE